MTLSEILDRKGRTVYSISVSATLADVVERLVQHNVGSLVVFDGGRMTGIITERDILRASARADGALETLYVADHMTRNVVTAAARDTIADAMGALTRERIRHLPVMDGPRVEGLVSIGDLVKWQLEALSAENAHLVDYIHADGRALSAKT